MKCPNKICQHYWSEVKQKLKTHSIQCFKYSLFFSTWISLSSPKEVLKILSNANGATASNMLNSSPFNRSCITFTKICDFLLKVGKKLFKTFVLKAGSKIFLWLFHKTPFDMISPESFIDYIIGISFCVINKPFLNPNSAKKLGLSRQSLEFNICSKCLGSSTNTNSKCPSQNFLGDSPPSVICLATLKRAFNKLIYKFWYLINLQTNKPLLSAPTNLYACPIRGRWPSIWGIFDANS